MTNHSDAIIHIINILIDKDRSFAIWRVPGEELRFVMQTEGEPILSDRLDDIDGKKGFVIAPFEIGGKDKIVLISPDRLSIPSEEEAEAMERIPHRISDEEAPKDESAEKASYEEAFDRFMTALSEGKVEKLVLSRKSRKRKENVSTAELFFEAERSYVNSFVYLCNTPHSGTWIGCSPEILLSGHEREWTTVALAGTQPLLPDGTLPTEWDDKNRREQALVSEYIASQLRSLSVRYEAEGPIGVKAVSLAHLKSIFRFSLPNEITLGKALAHLHPTPAVCGTPKQESYRFILNNEGYDRRYYSGFVGYVDPEGVTDIYVNLRCARVDGHEYHLYAGGGLLKSSVKQHEWIETQRKMRTILSLIEEQEIQ